MLFGWLFKNVLVFVVNDVIFFFMLLLVVIVVFFMFNCGWIVCCVCVVIIGVKVIVSGKRIWIEIFVYVM